MRTFLKLLIALLLTLIIPINWLGNSDWVFSVIHDPNSSPTLKMALGFIASHPTLISAGLIAIACLGLYVVFFGIPFFKTKEQIAEDGAYHEIIEIHGDGGGGIAINSFFKAGAHKLPKQTVKSLCKRLRQVGLDIFPNDAVPKRHQVRFITRARRIGRVIRTPREALESFDEWKNTQTLRAPWESWPEPTGFPENVSPENVIARTLRISKLTDIIGDGLLEIRNATSQNLPISELAAKLASAGVVPKVPQIEPHIIDDCRYVSSQQQWPEFSEVAKHLDGLNALVTQFNSEPNIDRAKRILEESMQVIPPMLEEIRRQTPSRVRQP